MQTFNYHTHTFRCGHANGTDEEYVLAAVKAGYTILGFSDHGPYPGIPFPRGRMDYEQLDEYVSSISLLKEKYRDQIDIKIGLEVEYFPDFYDHYVELKKKVDYLLLGQHFMNPYGANTFFRFNTDDQIEAYADFICEGLDTGLFTYLCHPDVFLYNQPVFNETCEKAIRTILEKASSTHTPLEVNLHGTYRGKILSPEGREDYCYPNRTFWTMASKYPVRCLYGVDAHDPAQLLDKEALEKAEKEVSGLGLSFIKELLL